MFPGIIVSVIPVISVDSRVGMYLPFTFKGVCSKKTELNKTKIQQYILSTYIYSIDIK